MPEIYLDYAATTPCDPAVWEAMRPFFNERFGNPLSPHAFGRRARKALEESREQVAALLGANPTEVILTANATEANNQAIFGVAYAQAAKGKHIIVTAIEHHCVLEPIRRLKAEGFEISVISPDPRGMIDPAAIESAIRLDTILIAVGHANNEIGTIQPVEKICALAKSKGIYTLVDAVQTAGHIPVDLKSISCDLLSVSAHKFYGPPGIGALFMRQGTRANPLLLGGDQERSRRAGTPNVPGAVGMAKALSICVERMNEEQEVQVQLRDRMIKEVLASIAGSRLNGDSQGRLPNNAHFSFEGIKGEDLVAVLDMAGIYTSVGSACSAGTLTPSHVLKAIGLSDAVALGSLRVTIGRWTKPEDIQYFVEQLKIKVNQLRA